MRRSIISFPFQKNMDVAEKELDEIVRAVFYLSKRHIGALIVLEREIGLRDYEYSGTPFFFTLQSATLTTHA